MVMDYGPNTLFFIYLNKSSDSYLHNSTRPLTNIFSSKLYKIRAQLLDYLGKKLRPFTTPNNSYQLNLFPLIAT